MKEFTPMMKQYLAIKDNYPDCIVFYRLGDFYEMFFGDAKVASEVLGLTLTGRDCGQEERAPMCGVPFHSCDGYIAKLVKAGYKVAICEQTQDPNEATGIVERKVIKVITPGTITLPDVLEDTKNNFLIAIYKSGLGYGIAAADVSTGELYATSLGGVAAKTDLLNELSKYSPSEVVYNDFLAADKAVLNFIGHKFKCLAQKRAELPEPETVELLKKHLSNKLTKAVVEQERLGILATGLLIAYLEETQMTDLSQFNFVEFYQSEQYLGLDTVARYNLELTKTMREQEKKGSLLWVLDKTCTAMGGRMMATWVQQPLVSCAQIRRRHEAVEELLQKHALRSEIRTALSGIRDMERMIAKIDYGSANPKDMLGLKESIKSFPALLQSMRHLSSSLVKELCTEFDDLEDIRNVIHAAIDDDAPFTVREGGIIKKGYDEELDTWRSGKEDGASQLLTLEAKEREETGIKNLKINFNKVFGYYIEVTKSYFDLVPAHYVRKQTLANCERYITDELKVIEDLVLRSDDKIVAKEYRLFCAIRERIRDEIERIQRTAKVIASMDVLASLAETAYKNNYVKPEIDLSGEIDIKDGRHPVVEKVMTDSLFVPNDTYLDKKDSAFSIITGPNMAGKSTYMRQTALIVIMAQMGSFVPASSARIGIVDKIFTRIGASDDLSSGQSTFMVEMNEVANIIENSTENSLLILDEIGRGTSTFDGLSIAWAVVEYIADAKKIGARTLFATHYHELTELEDKIPGVKNYSVVAKKRDDTVVFLRKIVRGGADESYGIEVASLAGIPDTVIKRAKTILKALEEKGTVQVKGKEKVSKLPETQGLQFDFSQAPKDELLEEIKKIDINVLSPIEAMNKLFEIKKKADEIL
ncbi:MAG: DNA mismatch repair protein MutS [Clostridia bacterium]|nr:DNA mismatch repair protein MutS [Clostridia bacterium]